MNFLDQLNTLSSDGDASPDPRLAAVQQIAEKRIDPNLTGVPKAIQDLIARSKGNYQMLRQNPQYRRLEDKRSNYESTEGSADDFGGRLDNPDLPSAKDLHSVKDRFDEDTEEFINRFGIEQLDRENRDPRTGLRTSDYVPLPRERIPFAHERNRYQQDEADQHENNLAWDMNWRFNDPLTMRSPRSMEERQADIPRSVRHPEMDYEEYRIIRDNARAARGELDSPAPQWRLEPEQFLLLQKLKAEDEKNK